MSRVFENKRKPVRRGNLVNIGSAADIPEGRGVTIRFKDDTELALFHIDGHFFAIENFCPHRGYPIADSRVYDKTVECDVHGWRFDLQNGECLTDTTCPLESYQVTVEDGIVQILV